MNKEIIEIIEPYMDKTLSDGCIIEINKSFTYWVWKNITPYYSIFNKFGWCTYWTWERDKDWSFKNWWHWDKIIWHYEITAVLKYIEVKNQQSYIDIIWDNLKILVKTQSQDLEENYKTFFIPNKPLHLYTDQEQSDLLALLLKLNK